MPVTSKVFGIFSKPQQAENAVDELLNAEFDLSLVTVLLPDNQASRDFAHRKNTRLPEGTAFGATSTLPLGGTLGVMDPGAGPQGGALSQALAQMGVPAEWCDGRVLAGKFLVSVECEFQEQLPKSGQYSAQRRGGTDRFHHPASEGRLILNYASEWT